MGRVLKFYPKGVDRPQQEPIVAQPRSALQSYDVRMEYTKTVLFSKQFEASGPDEATRMGVDDPSWEGWAEVNKSEACRHVMTIAREATDEHS